MDRKKEGFRQVGGFYSLGTGVSYNIKTNRDDSGYIYKSGVVILLVLIHYTLHWI
jgi:hypothetical protein